MGHPVENFINKHKDNKCGTNTAGIERISYEYVVKNIFLLGKVKFMNSFNLILCITLLCLLLLRIFDNQTPENLIKQIKMHFVVE